PPGGKAPMFYRPARPVASARPGKFSRKLAFVSPRGERREASAFPAPAAEQTLSLTSGGSALRGATGHVATRQFVARFPPPRHDRGRVLCALSTNCTTSAPHDPSFLPIISCPCPLKLAIIHLFGR